MAFLSRTLFLVIFATKICAEPCKKYGCPLDPPAFQPFVPAPPGHTPRCARPGQTYCETLDHYPQQLIKFLLDECSFNFNSILKDESTGGFNLPRAKPNTSTSTSGYQYHKAEITFTEGSAVPANYGPPPITAHQRSFLDVTRMQSQSDNGESKTAASSYGFNLFYPSVSLVAPSLDQNFWVNRFFPINDVTTAPRTRRQNPLLQFANQKQKRARRQSNSDYISICPTRSEYLTPKAALNSNGNWMYVVNLEQEQGYSQTVRSEICTRDTCDGLCTLPEGYTSRCQQQYVQKRLVALEGSGNRLYNDVFLFPHGCGCEVMLN